MIRHIAGRRCAPYSREYAYKAPSRVRIRHLGHSHFSYQFFLIAPRERALERPCSSPTSFAARSHDGVGMMRNQGIGREHFQHAIDNTTFPDSNLSIRKGGGADLHLIEALYGKPGEDTSNVSSTIRVRSVYFCTMNPARSEWP